MLGQLASPDPDADHAGLAQLANHGEKILGCLLVCEPTNSTDYRRIGGNTESTAGAVSGSRQARRQFSSCHAIHGHPDGADTLGRDQPPPDGLDCYSGPDAQRHIGDSAKSPLPCSRRTL